MGEILLDAVGRAAAERESLPGKSSKLKSTEFPGATSCRCRHVFVSLSIHILMMSPDSRVVRRTFLDIADDGFTAVTFITIVAGARRRMRMSNMYRFTNEPRAFAQAVGSVAEPLRFGSTKLISRCPVAPSSNTLILFTRSCASASVQLTRPTMHLPLCKCPSLHPSSPYLCFRSLLLLLQTIGLLSSLIPILNALPRHRLLPL
jgi:hypothetical protein